MTAGPTGLTREKKKGRAGGSKEEVSEEAVLCYNSTTRYERKDTNRRGEQGLQQDKNI